MRLWHKNLIKVLPGPQLRLLWRDCCQIAMLIAEKDSPMCTLVNVVTDYPPGHLLAYASIVYHELHTRKIPCEWVDFSEWAKGDPPRKITKDIFLELFQNWHTGRYYIQCYYMLQEIYDRGGMASEDWIRIVKQNGTYNYI